MPQVQFSGSCSQDSGPQSRKSQVPRTQFWGSGSQDPSSRVLGVRVSCLKVLEYRISGFQIPRSRVSGSQSHRVLSLSVLGSWVSRSRVLGSQGSGFQVLRVPGLRVSGSRALRVPSLRVAGLGVLDPGSQVLILDYAKFVLLKPSILQALTQLKSTLQTSALNFSLSKFLWFTIFSGSSF